MVTTQPPPTTIEESRVGDPEGAEVIAMLNAERARLGRAPIEIHPLVSEAATIHSADQAASGVMSHTGRDGSSAGDRLERVGFQWRGWGENVGAGQRTPEQIYQGWYNSDGHRRNMFGDYRYIGVAVEDAADGTRFWTMVLAN